MTLTEEQIERYSRQIVLPEVGGKGQARLLSASVFIVGAGGLGTPAAIYLAASGIGKIGLADPDEVDLSNLPRQVAFATGDVGRSKTQAIRDHLMDLRSDLELELFDEHVTASNFEDVVSGYDLVIDSSDNFETRYLVADECHRLRIPLVTASIFQFEGQVTTIVPDGPCYRCLYPEPPPPGRVPPCQEAGVLGVVPGVIGSIQASESLKVILGKGELLVGRLLFYRSLDSSFRIYRYGKTSGCRATDGREDRVSRHDHGLVK